MSFSIAAALLGHTKRLFFRPPTHPLCPPISRSREGWRGSPLHTTTREYSRSTWDQQDALCRRNTSRPTPTVCSHAAAQKHHTLLPSTRDLSWLPQQVSRKARARHRFQGVPDNAWQRLKDDCLGVTVSVDPGKMLYLFYFIRWNQKKNVEMRISPPFPHILNHPMPIPKSSERRAINQFRRF